MGIDWHLPLIASAIVLPATVLTWLAQRRSGNAGWIDFVWTVSVGGCAIGFALFEDGWWPRRALVALMAAIWTERLGWHLLERLRREPEDGRYADLRERWGPRFQHRLLWFFVAQGLLAIALALPALVISAATLEGWRPGDAVALALFVLSIAGEAHADRTLRRFRARPSNEGRVCRAGLWRYSRHPNYFFEWLHWFSYPLLGLGLPGGWALWLAPLAMYLLITRVTGIPPVEERAARTRGAEWAAYVRTTPAFFPGPPRAVPADLAENR